MQQQIDVALAQRQRLQQPGRRTARIAGRRCVDDGRAGRAGAWERTGYDGHRKVLLEGVRRHLGLEEHVQLEAEERTAVEELNDLYCTRELVYSSATPGQPVLKPGQSIRTLLALATKLQGGLRGVCRPAPRVGSTPQE